MRDPTDIVSAEQQALEHEQARQRERRQEIEDFKWLAAHRQGRRILWRMLERSGQMKSSMTGNSFTFYNEGARAFGRWIVEEFHEHSIEAYVQMVKENVRE